MTASMNKKKKKKRINKLALFAGVLCGVVAVGSAALFAMAAYGRTGLRQGEEGESGRQEQSEETQKSQDGLIEDIRAEILPAQGQDESAQEEAEPESKYGGLLQDPEKMRTEKIYAKEAASGDEIVMAFAGDILFDPSYAVMARLQQRGGAVTEAFSEDLLAEMRNADIFMVNNEFPYTSRGEPLTGKQFTFRARPESAAYLTEMGVDIVSLANNHAFDYGEISLLDTLDTLEAMDMPYVGAGRDLEEAKKPASFLINDTRIAIVSATQIERSDNPDTRGAREDLAGVFRCWDPGLLLEEIAAAKAENDIVIVYIHWGTENQAQIDWAQRDQAAKIAEAGADLIIGDHPHCLQPVGYVGEVPVVYSLGNFWFNSRSLDTALVRVRITSQGISVQLIPARQSDCRTVLLTGAEKERVISYINSISENGVLDAEGYLSAKTS